MANINIIKSMISHSFNRAATSYDNNCSTQLHAGERLIATLKMFASQFGQVLDLGCGTGLITEKLLNSIPCENVYAVDIADELLKVAKYKLRAYSVQVCQADFDEQILNSQSVQLIFSNMALQWSTQLSNTLKFIYQQLEYNGIFAFSLPIAGTLSELEYVAKNNFFNLETINSLLADNGFKILHQNFESIINDYESSLQALHSIKAVGANFTLNKQHRGLRGKHFLDKLLQQNCKTSNKYLLTYNIAYFIAQKGNNDL